MAVSLRPSTFAAGGGLVDDADLTVKCARFEMNDYGGKSDSGPQCVLKLTVADDEGAEFEQLYSTGQGFVPNEDADPDKSGVEILPIGNKTAPSGSSNFALLINSVVNQGFPEDLLDSGSIAVLEGLKGHWNQVAQPKRANLPTRPGQNDRPKTTLLLTSLISLPGEKAPAKPGATASKTAAKSGAGTTVKADTPATTGDSALTEELVGELMAVVANGPVKKVAIAPALFKGIDNTNQNKKALIAMAGKNEVLSSLGEYGLAFDGTTLKMAE